ncbi:MAG: diguanylate cyclase [Nitrospirota bacterium]
MGTLSGSFLKKHFLLIFASLAYSEAVLSPFLGLGWESPALIVCCGLVLFLLASSLWKLTRTARSYPATDLIFIVSIILTVNLFSILLGPDKRWLEPLDYLLVALCTIYYSFGFNSIVAVLIFVLEAAGVVSHHGKIEVGPLVNLLVFGGYLAGTVLVLGRLFQSEQKKKERAVLAMKRLHEGADSIGSEGTGGESVKSITPEGRLLQQVESAAELDGALEGLLKTASSAIPSDNALLFMPTSDGTGVYLRVHTGKDSIEEHAVIPIGQGLIGWVSKEKRPILAPSAAGGPGYAVEGACSFLAVPIMNGSFLEGVIALDASREDAFSEGDKEILSGFADIALSLLSNARAYQQVDLSARNFAALHRISTSVSSSLDLKTILERLAQLSREIIPYDYMTVSFTEGEDSVVFKMLKGYENARQPDGPVQLANSLLGWIVENRQPLCFTDLDQRTQKLPIFPEGKLKADFKSFLGIPFLSQDKAQGVLTVALREPRAISAYQQHMLSIIANQVAVNIANAKLHHMMQMMATTDGLTGLINHRHFQEKADEEFERCKRLPVPLAVMLMDIDHFKRINDTYGHPVGDAVLKKVSKILRETVRAVDIAARYGGEEFIALLLNTDLSGAGQMAERIRTSIGKSRFLLNGENIPVTISIGYAVYPQDAADKKDLIEKADQALYWAKGNGRNRSCPYNSVSGELALRKV